MKTGQDFMDFLNHRILDYEEMIKNVPPNTPINSPMPLLMKGVRDELKYIESTARKIYRVQEMKNG